MPLLLLAAILAAVVPLLYLLNPDPSAQGIYFDYPLDRVGAHWVAIASMLALTVASVIEILRLRRGRIGKSAETDTLEGSSSGE